MKDWEDIRFVMNIVRHGGLQPAGAQMGLSHSTLSRRLTALETKLNAKLFERISGRLVPNDAAIAIARAGAEMEQNAAELDLELFAKNTDVEGTLKITAAALLIDGFLAPHLAEFARSYPQVELHINAAHSNLNLSKREADVAIRATNSPEDELLGRRLVVQRRTVYAAPTYLESMKSASQNGTREPMGWLGFDWWQGDDVAAMGDYIVARFDDMSALRSALRCGMGVAKLPCFLGDTDRSLVRVPQFEVEDYVDFWVLTHASLKDVARVRLFMSFIAERFSQSRDLFAGDAQPKRGQAAQ